MNVCVQPDSKGRTVRPRSITAIGWNHAPTVAYVSTKSRRSSLRTTSMSVSVQRAGLAPIAQKTWTNVPTSRTHARQRANASTHLAPSFAHALNSTMAHAVRGRIFVSKAWQWNSGHVRMVACALSRAMLKIMSLDASARMDTRESSVSSRPVRVDRASMTRFVKWLMPLVLRAIVPALPISGPTVISTKIRGSVWIWSAGRICVIQLRVTVIIWIV